MRFIRKFRNIGFKFFHGSLVEFLNVRDFFIVSFLERIHLRTSTKSLILASFLKCSKSRSETIRLFISELQCVGVLDPLVRQPKGESYQAYDESP